MIEKQNKIMKQLLINLKHWYLLALVFSCLAVTNTFAEDQATAVAATSTDGGFDFNIILFIVAVLLLLPVYVLSKTFILSFKMFMSKKSGKALKVIIAFALIIPSAHAEGSVFSSISSVIKTFDTASYLLLTVIVFELIVLAVLGLRSIGYMKGLHMTEEELKKDYESNSFSSLWDKINSFRPMEDEAAIDTGHSYDGIRELDNVTPPWFTTAFLFTIVFAGVYLWRYHVAQAAPLQIEEFNKEMAEAKKERELFLKDQSNNIDESSVVMMGQADIDAGKELFGTTCKPCHADHGGSMVGGVGPNLTDEYWLHGGSIVDVFKSIKYGWPEKGMISWKEQYTPKQMSQLTSFIMSIKGTNPPGAKEPQGEKYVEQSAPAATSAPPADSTAKK